MGEVLHTFNERKVLSWLCHPSILKLHYCFQTETKLYMVLDLITGGDLFYNLKKVENNRFSPGRVQFYIAQLVLLLEYLQSKSVLYRDIKPENLLIKKNGYLVLCDFGLAKEGMNKNARTRTFCGTSEYYAPEILLGKEYGIAVDWWQLGTLMYELLMGVPPFYDQDEGDMFYKIVQAPLEFNSDVSPETRDILTKFLQRDPIKRLQDPSVIKQHPYFSGIDWKKLENQEIVAPYFPEETRIEDLNYIEDNYSSSDDGEESTLKNGTWVGFEYP